MLWKTEGKSVKIGCEKGSDVSNEHLWYCSRTWEICVAFGGEEGEERGRRGGRGGRRGEEGGREEGEEGGRRGGG